MVKFKVRSVADERTQIQDMDYDDFSAPSPFTPAFKTALAVVVQKALQLFHFDTIQAFFKAGLDHT